MADPMNVLAAGKAVAESPSLRPAMGRLRWGELLTGAMADIHGAKLALVERARAAGETIVCGQGGIPCYQDTLRLIGNSLFQNKVALSGQQIAIITLDKSRLNPINALLGREGGDASLRAAMDCILAATQKTFGPALAPGNRPYVIRYSPFSDEITLVAVGRGITREMLDSFQGNLRDAAESLDLSGYRWPVPGGNGTPKSASLAAVSGMFRHPELLPTATLGGQCLLDVDSIERPDFLIEAVDRADRAKLDFLGSIPGAYRGIPATVDVDCPFNWVLGPGPLPPGTVVEIKLRRSLSGEEWASEAELLMAQVVRSHVDGSGKMIRKGAKKCLYELRSGILGRRFGNTIAGVSGCNSMLIVPVLHGAYEFSMRHGVVAVPSDDMNFIYLGAERSPALLSALESCVSARLLPGFRPSITALPSQGLTGDGLRAEFELEELGMRGRAGMGELLSANFMVNFIENASWGVKGEIFSRLGAGNLAMLLQAGEMFAQERTIRNVQDYTASALATGREALVQWMWDFTKGPAAAVRQMLSESYK